MYGDFLLLETVGAQPTRASRLPIGIQEGGMRRGFGTCFSATLTPPSDRSYRSAGSYEPRPGRSTSRSSSNGA